MPEGGPARDGDLAAPARLQLSRPPNSAPAYVKHITYFQRGHRYRTGSGPFQCLRVGLGQLLHSPGIRHDSPGNEESMSRFIKRLFVLALIGGAIYGTSYVGARATSGKFLGPRPPDLGTRKVQFAFGGVHNLPGRPRVWIVSYGPTEIAGATTIRFYISPTGELLRTYPEDLEERLKPYARQFP